VLGGSARPPAARLKTAKPRVTEAVVASATTLADLYGVGSIVAAIVIG
jgi:hypothetical protein